MKDFLTFISEQAPTNSTGPAITGANGQATDGDGYPDQNAAEQDQNTSELNDLLRFHRSLHKRNITK